ncbi:hypothetical protein BpHYR1_024357 [Brachionus plicatilis]|uniref:Uncharacterized protein n=1 Tax=Brachionus plicatilis TaxID=10195 RepID=A0A3M7QYS2_BRAPC|nr:hypothetical protein BpHYR1_024357 [Brachionus plicatilis]
MEFKLLSFYCYLILSGKKKYFNLYFDLLILISNFNLPKKHSFSGRLGKLWFIFKWTVLVPIFISREDIWVIPGQLDKNK